MINSEECKQIALDLIVNDLVNSKLIMGLHALNIEAGCYSLYLAESIFKLMGFNDQQRISDLYDRYAQLSRKAAEVPISDTDRTAMQALALEIFETLLRENYHP